MTTNQKNKAASIKKIIIKTIVGLIIACIAFPILLIIGFAGLTGKVIGFVFYAGLVSYALYEFTRIFSLNKWISFYIAFLALISFFFPLNELIGWFQDKEISFSQIIRMQYSFKFVYPGIGFAVFIILISIPFLFISFSKNHFYIYLMILVAFFVISITGKALTYSSNKYIWYVVIIFVAAIAADTFAYLGGMLLGNKIFKHKLAPKISPNKTIEGAIAGYIISFLILFLALYFGNLGISFHWWIQYLIIPILLPLVAILGDLVFSFVKRFVNVKDFSNFIPGHGGILDRIDSVILTSFIFLMFLMI